MYYIDNLSFNTCIQLQVSHEIAKYSGLVAN